MVIKNLIGLDTNIFIYYFQSHQEFGPASRSIFASLATSKTKAVTSIISLIELLSLVNSPEPARKLTALYLETPNLTTLDVSQEIGLESARIRRQYGYRLPDAIQLSTSLVAKAEKFITNDKGLRNFKEIKIQLLTDLV